MLDCWCVGQEACDAAELVLSELVTNALKAPDPGGGQVGVRIARSEEDGLLRLEVSDAGGGRPQVRSPAEDETGGRGLLLVDLLAHRWGVQECVGAVGKTVWAELKAPDVVPVPAGTTVAAVTVRPGQRVRLREEWRTIRGVRAEHYTSGGLAVLLSLDDGQVLRLHAAEPVTVLDEGSA
ncbi:hypothetical protein GCM10009716_08250 [Streptomyces sodiiphilus]|uniref:Histidine kinase/HSP90-like ATPase domain-containing protein n=1 Tax=Streptomyces sodiiphilus TaxID=226217 RepID=A0ABP5A3I0_9ACTN